VCDRDTVSFQETGDNATLTARAASLFAGNRAQSAVLCSVLL
jgi:hypothetical protein